MIVIRLCTRSQQLQHAVDAMSEWKPPIPGKNRVQRKLLYLQVVVQKVSRAVVEALHRFPLCVCGIYLIAHPGCQSLPNTTPTVGHSRYHGHWLYPSQITSMQANVAVTIHKLIKEVQQTTLPSSTPHWSKEFIPQIKPIVATLCSCRASSCANNQQSTGQQSLLIGNPTSQEL